MTVSECVPTGAPYTCGAGPPPPASRLPSPLHPERQKLGPALVPLLFPRPLPVTTLLAVHMDLTTRGPSPQADSRGSCLSVTAYLHPQSHPWCSVCQNLLLVRTCAHPTLPLCLPGSGWPACFCLQPLRMTRPWPWAHRTSVCVPALACWLEPAAALLFLSSRQLLSTVPHCFTSPQTER